MKKIILTITLLVVVTALLILTGPTNAEITAENNLYCEMVELGHWPDYANKYNNICLGNK